MSAPLDRLVGLLSGVLPKSKIYPEVVPASVQLPYIRYTENTDPEQSYDGEAGGTTTSVVTICADTKAEASRLADTIVLSVNMQSVCGCDFYLQGKEYIFYDQERISSYDITFKILTQ